MFDDLLQINKELRRRNRQRKKKKKKKKKKRSIEQELNSFEESMKMISKRFIRFLMIFIDIQLFLNSTSYAQSENDLSRECLMTFDQLSISIDLSNLKSIRFICPSSCFTRIYLSNHNQYPIYGNETYSGNSLICKSALHDGRLIPSNSLNSSLLIRNNSYQTNNFLSTIRNGILSTKSTTKQYFVYQFLEITNQITVKEKTIPDIAIEHRNYLYSTNEISTISCRSQNEIQSIEQFYIDQKWKIWKENSLKLFTFPHNLTRNNSLDFCLKNNGTFLFWRNIHEENLIEEYLRETIFPLFQYQRKIRNNQNLTFFIGLKQINRTKFWESNIIDYNQSFETTFNSIDNENDYCTILHFDGSIRLLDHRCDDNYQIAYPLCRLQQFNSIDNEEFFYRVDTDIRQGNLFDVINYCSQYGGYPIYARNAYEWQIVQEIMLKDDNFNEPYVFTDFYSRTQRLNDALWISRNLTVKEKFQEKNLKKRKRKFFVSNFKYNHSLDYIRLSDSRSSNGYSYHLSKANDESYYYLYDINPMSQLNRLRFCRKDDLRIKLKRNRNCNDKTCRVQCENIELPKESENLRFGFYVCRPKESLSGIILTHSFPKSIDFIRENTREENRVSLRRPFNQSEIQFQFEQTDPNLRLSCFQYNYFDQDSTFDDTKRLNCDLSNTFNRTINGISFKKDFNGLISIGFEERRISSHHFRMIDYFHVDNRCRSQGIFHPFIDQCICSPGFYGNQCEYSCPTGFYGQTCHFHCLNDKNNNENEINNYCRGSLICLPDPYGCSCYSGWHGVQCDLPCPNNRYGPDCSYNCPCSTCNRFTGICDCNGTECYRGPITRSQLESQCLPSSKSSNLALIIVLPIVGVTLLSIVTGLIVYHQLIKRNPRNFLFKKRREEFSPQSSIF